jgi:hypothetical protein
VPVHRRKYGYFDWEMGYAGRQANRFRARLRVLEKPAGNGFPTPRPGPCAWELTSPARAFGSCPARTGGFTRFRTAACSW